MTQAKVVERKLFSQIESINTMYPNEENMIFMPITKRIEIVMSIQVRLISQINFEYKENGGKNAFFQIQSINIMYPNMETRLSCQ